MNKILYDSLFNNPELLPGKLTVDLAAYDKIVAQARETVIKKNQDYSGGRSFDNISAGGVYGVVIRMLDKVSRLMTLTAPNAEPAAVKSESIEDTLMDLLNYSIIATLLLRGQWKPGSARTAGGLQEATFKLMLSCKALHSYAEQSRNELVRVFLEQVGEEMAVLDYILPKDTYTRLDRSSKLIPAPDQIMKAFLPCEVPPEEPGAHS